MTKTYPIIESNGFLCAVNYSEGPYKEEDFVISDSRGVRIIIVASNNPKLKKVASLPPYEESVDDLAMKIYPVNMVSAPNSHSDYFPYDVNKNDRDKWIEGYKANKAKYSEEDVSKIALYFAERGSWLMEQQGRERKEGFGELLACIKQDVSKVPKAVELEMYIKCYCGHTDKCDCCGDADGGDNVLYHSPKVDENNYVIVKQWIW